MNMLAVFVSILRVCIRYVFENERRHFCHKIQSKRQGIEIERKNWSKFENWTSVRVKMKMMMVHLIGIDKNHSIDEHHQWSTTLQKIRNVKTESAIHLFFFVVLFLFCVGDFCDRNLLWTKYTTKWYSQMMKMQTKGLKTNVQNGQRLMERIDYDNNRNMTA